MRDKGKPWTLVPYNEVIWCLDEIYIISSLYAYMYFIRVGKGYSPEYPYAFAAIKKNPRNFAKYSIYTVW